MHRDEQYRPIIELARAFERGEEIANDDPRLAVAQRLMEVGEDDFAGLADGLVASDAIEELCWGDEHALRNVVFAQLIARLDGRGNAFANRLSDAMSSGAARTAARSAPVRVTVP